MNTYNLHENKNQRNTGYMKQVTNAFLGVFELALASYGKEA